MALIGTRDSFGQSHPRTLIDAVYAEVFDLHPADAEIDMVVALGHSSETDVVVLDYKLYRVSGGPDAVRERFLAVPLGDDGNPTPMLKDMIAWGLEARRRFETPDNDVSLFWFHKHPEGMAYASERDEWVNDVLSSIDYAHPDSPESLRRTYQGGAVVNRAASEPLIPLDNPVPFGDDENDSMVTDRMGKMVIKKHNLAADHPFVVAHKQLVELMARRSTLDDNGERELKRLAFAAQVHMPGSPFSKLPPQIQEALGRALTGQPVGFQPPQPPQPPQAPSPPRTLNDIFRLPPIVEQRGIPAQDNIELPKPPDKDRLN